MKAIIVNRVSTNKQDPKLQRKDCLDFCKRKGFEVIKIFEEIASAGKSKQKQIFEAEKLAIKENAIIVVWKYDRSFRNKKDFVLFMLKMYEIHSIKVYSVREEWVNMLWELTETIDLSKIPEPYDQMMKEQFKLQWRNMIRIIGKVAEQEVKDKGARVRNAVRSKPGTITKSYKGNKWGRKTSYSKKVIKEIIDLKNKNPTMSYQNIADSIWYWKKKNSVQCTKTSVARILKAYSQSFQNTS